MNIDFKKFKVYDTLDKTTPIILDISKELANGLYKTAQGIDGHALALKIYNSTGEEDYNDLEIELIAKYANQYGTPFFIDALNSIKNEQSITQIKQLSDRELLEGIYQMLLVVMQEQLISDSKQLGINVIADLLVDNMYRNRERNENNNNAPYLGQQSIAI